MSPDDEPLVAEFVPEMDQSPPHREELVKDSNRALNAISFAPDKYRLVEPYLMNYEQPVAIAVQRQFPFSVFSDIALLTSHRLLMFKRFFTKITMFDVNYVDFLDMTVQQGFFTSALTLRTANRRSCTMSRLVTDQALHLYRLTQDIETKARIARRQFVLEENRSRTTQMNINNVTSAQTQPAPPQIHNPVRRDISTVGDEEANPFRIGD